MEIARLGRQIWENQYVNSWEFWKEKKGTDGGAKTNN